MLLSVKLNRYIASLTEEINKLPKCGHKMTQDNTSAKPPEKDIVPYKGLVPYEEEGCSIFLWAR